MVGKKIKGRKRHIVVDVMGNLLWVFVHAANIHDTVAGIVPAHGACLRYPRIEAFCGDRGYRKTFEEDVKLILNRHIDISEKIKPHGWKLLPKRWVVERTFGWLDKCRRLWKNCERKLQNTFQMITLAFMRILLQRY